MNMTMAALVASSLRARYLDHAFRRGNSDLVEPTITIRQIKEANVFCKHTVSVPLAYSTRTAYRVPLIRHKYNRTG